MHSSFPSDAGGDTSAMHALSTLAIRVAAVTDVGGRSYNEDLTAYSLSDRFVCCMVADGAGGHGGGDVAAELAVRAALATVTQIVKQDAAAGTTVFTAAAMQATIEAAHQAVVSGQAGGGRLSTMCTTLVVLCIDRANHNAIWAHSGDSRLYLLRAGDVYRQTMDHSLMASMIEAGLITQAQADVHPKRHVLLSALGVAGTPEIAIGGSEEPLQAGDTFMLCTDGMWEHLPSDALLTRGGCASPSAWLDQMMATVQQRAPVSADNCSAIAVWLD